MTEPTITCPNCQTAIKLTESLAAPLIASTRQQFEKQLAEKDHDIAKREQAMRDKEKQLADAKMKLDEQVAQQLQGEVQKLELENLLRTKFPFDTIEPVPKGEHGGDVLHRVIVTGMQPCGMILWESKRTKIGATAG